MIFLIAETCLFASLLAPSLFISAIFAVETKKVPHNLHLLLIRPFIIIVGHLHDFCMCVCVRALLQGYVHIGLHNCLPL